MRRSHDIKIEEALVPEHRVAALYNRTGTRHQLLSPSLALPGVEVCVRAKSGREIRQLGPEVWPDRS